jgi:hypothetical protein
MKIITEIIKKYPQINFEYKVEKIKGYPLPFHTLYVGESPIVSIMEDHEPKTGTEKNGLMEIVDNNVKPYLPY